MHCRCRGLVPQQSACYWTCLTTEQHSSWASWKHSGTVPFTHCRRGCLMNQSCRRWSWNSCRLASVYCLVSKWDTYHKNSLEWILAQLRENNTPGVSTLECLTNIFSILMLTSYIDQCVYIFLCIKEEQVSKSVTISQVCLLVHWHQRPL